MVGGEGNAVPSSWSLLVLECDHITEHLDERDIANKKDLPIYIFKVLEVYRYGTIREKPHNRISHKKVPGQIHITGHKLNKNASKNPP